MQQDSEILSTPGKEYINSTTYPSLIKRVQSTFIDGIITFILIGLLVSLANHINDDNVALKVIAIIIGISYEPVMTSFGRTFGQKLMGMKVRTVDEIGRTNLLAAYMRYIVKNVLGWLSFITMHSNPQKRAIHDFVANTVVIATLLAHK